MDLQRVGTLVCEVGESPVWSDRDAAWLWVDIPGRRIWRFVPGSGALRSWSTAEMAACIALAEDGSLVAGMESGVFRIELDESSDAARAQLLAPVRHARENMRFNDGRCDRQGRFWSGTMFMDMSQASDAGNLYCYTTASGLSAPVVDKLITQNGLAWSPDGRTMYLSDSHPNRRLIWAYDFDPDDGVPSNRRVFVDMHDYPPGRPDGAAMDADGCYWVCANDGSELLRFTPKGELDRSLPLPMAKPSMCAFGGPNLDSLLVTSIGANRRPDDAWAGSVVVLQPGVQGMPEPKFKL
jgi:sugar lactone lactonase YvrE